MSALEEYRKSGSWLAVRPVNTTVGDLNFTVLAVEMQLAEAAIDELLEMIRVGNIGRADAEARERITEHKVAMMTEQWQAAEADVERLKEGCCANCAACTPAGCCTHKDAGNSVRQPVQSDFRCRYWQERRQP